MTIKIEREVTKTETVELKIPTPKKNVSCLGVGAIGDGCCGIGCGECLFHRPNWEAFRKQNTEGK